MCYVFHTMATIKNLRKTSLSVSLQKATKCGPRVGLGLCPPEGRYEPLLQFAKKKYFLETLLLATRRSDTQQCEGLTFQLGKKARDVYLHVLVLRCLGKNKDALMSLNCLLHSLPCACLETL